LLRRRDCKNRRRRLEEGREEPAADDRRPAFLLTNESADCFGVAGPSLAVEPLLEQPQ
jgi:hypothetical protein